MSISTRPSLKLEEGTFNILLGTTLAGKTTLMQLMAGLDKPSSGEVWFRGKNVTGVPVQKRNVSMVYQQFINYPNFTVYENIASPLRVAGMAQDEIDDAGAEGRRTPAPDARCSSAGRTSSRAASSSAPRSRAPWSRISISSCSMSRSPISTTSCARNCATNCRKLFAGRKCIVVYATTEPSEALLFGGNTATLHRRPRHPVRADLDDLSQALRSHERPGVLRPADQHRQDRQEGRSRSSSSDKRRHGRPAKVGEGACPTANTRSASGRITSRPIAHGKDAPSIEGRVLVTELSGSESVIHFDMNGQTWVSQSHGIHPFEVGATAKLYVDVDQSFFFDANGRLIGEAPDGQDHARGPPAQPMRPTRSATRIGR